MKAAIFKIEGKQVQDRQQVHGLASPLSASQEGVAERESTNLFSIVQLSTSGTPNIEADAYALSGR